MLHESFEIRSVEGHSTVDESIQQHSQRPTVHFRSNVWSTFHDLGGRIQGTPTKRGQQRRGREHIRQTEIGDLKIKNRQIRTEFPQSARSQLKRIHLHYFRIASFVQQNVFQLEISMTNVMLQENTEQNISKMDTQFRHRLKEIQGLNEIPQLTF